MKIKEFYYSRISKTFRNIQGTTNISEVTNILRSYTYISVLYKIFWKNTDDHWIINGKAFLMNGISKNFMLNITTVFQIVQEFPGEVKTQGELIY